MLLTGCPSWFKKEDPVIITKVEKVEVFKPVPVCPTEIKTLKLPSRPSLLIDQLTDNDANDPGKVVQSYKASVKQLLNYSKELESSLNIHEKACEGL
jgi:hypothetical protein